MELFAFGGPYPPGSVGWAVATLSVNLGCLPNQLLEEEAEMILTLSEVLRVQYEEQARANRGR